MVSLFQRILGGTTKSVDIEPDVEAGQGKPAKKVRRETFVIRKEKFVLDPRYSPIKKLGQGAYGMVISAKDSISGKRVAIKKNINIFYNKTNAKRILREVKILNHFDHPNIVKILDVLDPSPEDDLVDLYMVLEYMPSDLHKVIHSDNSLTHEHIAYVIFQLLCAVKYMHSAGVYHRDIKPSNILIDHQCHLKLCDFGLARGVCPEMEVDVLTEYVVTRWYRAPEVVLTARSYTGALDVWAIGCIFAELYYRKPIFRGSDYTDQLKAIFRVIGSPTTPDIESCVSDPESVAFLKRLRPSTGVSWEELIPNASSDAIDLISQMLTFNPDKRVTVDDAIQHPCFKNFYQEDFVRQTSVAMSPLKLDFEAHTRSKSHLKSMIMDEIRVHRPEAQLSSERISRYSAEVPGHTKRLSDFIRRLSA